MFYRQMRDVTPTWLRLLEVIADGSGNGCRTRFYRRWHTTISHHRSINDVRLSAMPVCCRVPVPSWTLPTARTHQARLAPNRPSPKRLKNSSPPVTRCSSSWCTRRGTTLASSKPYST